MAGHLARNQVHAGSIPAALTTSGAVVQREDAALAQRRSELLRRLRGIAASLRCPSQFDPPRLHKIRVSAPGRAVGFQSRRTAFESLLTRNADRMASVTLTR